MYNNNNNVLIYDISKVSQKEKNKYHILMHIQGIQKNGADEPVCR